MENNVLYTVGELLMTETQVQDVRYVREEENCLYIITEEGEKYKLTVTKSET